MPVDDRRRLNLHRKLEAVLGQEEADTLMAHLPPVTWNEVATKDDVRAWEVALRKNVDAAVGQLGTQLRAEMQVLGSELRTEMHTGFATLRTEFVEATNRQIKWLVTFAAAWTTVLVTLVRHIP